MPSIANIQEELRYRADTAGVIRALGIDEYPGEMAIARELMQMQKVDS